MFFNNSSSKQEEEEDDFEMAIVGTVHEDMKRPILG